MQVTPDSPYNYPQYPNHYTLAAPEIARDTLHSPALALAVASCAGDRLSLCRAYNAHYVRWQSDRAYHCAVENSKRMADFRTLGYSVVEVNLAPLPAKALASKCLSHGRWLDLLLPVLRRAHALGLRVIPLTNGYDYCKTVEILDRERIHTPVHTLPADRKNYSRPGVRIFGEYRDALQVEELSQWLDYFASRR